MHPGMLAAVSFNWYHAEFETKLRTFKNVFIVQLKIYSDEFKRKLKYQFLEQTSHLLSADFAKSMPVFYLKYLDTLSLQILNFEQVHLTTW